MTERSGPGTSAPWVAKFSLLIFAFAPWTSGSTQADDLVIINARLFVGIDAEAIDGATLVISGDRIKSVNPANGIDREGAVVIDADGKTVMPGLIDTHVHLFFDLQEDPYFPTTDAEARSYIEGSLRGKLEAHLEHGFTSVLSPIDFWPQIIQVRERVASGEFRGPRLFVAGGVLVAPGGHYICRSRSEDRRRWCNEHISIPVGNAEQAREGVRRYAEGGVDAIVYDSMTNAPTLARDVVHALVDEAHQHRLPVLIHGSDAGRFDDLIAAGVDGFVHPPGGTLDDGPLLLSGIDNSVGLGITIGETEEAIRKGERSPEEIAAYEQTRSNVRSLLSKGALPVFASDMPGASPGDTLPIVLRSLTNLGLSNAEIVRASTLYAAHEVLGRHDLGSLEPGKLADILIVDGNPLQDLAALQQVAMVIKDGKIVVDNR